MNAPGMLTAFRVMFRTRPEAVGAVTGDYWEEDANKANETVEKENPGCVIISTQELYKPKMRAARFTAYRTYSHDYSRSHHVHDLTREEATDANRFPLGLQKDEFGKPYVWQYGLNDGAPIL